MDSIRAIYANSMRAVRTSGGLTNYFDITSGVRQGCALSPLLFIIYTDRITKEANSEPEALNELLFADQSLAHESEERLQEHTSSLNSTCEEYDVKTSVDMIEAMKVSRTPGTLNIKINYTNLKQVKEFKYLGRIFTDNGRMNRGMENRIQKANNVVYQLAPLLKHFDIPMETKSKIINSIFLPTLTCQRQTWIMKKPLKRKNTTCEMRCLRKVVNKIRRDVIPNTKVREMVGTQSIHHHNQQQRIKKSGHLTVLPIQHTAQRAFNTRFSGLKARRRPQKTWIN